MRLKAAVLVGGLAMSLGLSAAVGAQAHEVQLGEGDPWHGRPYLLDLRAQGILDQTNWWHGNAGMQEYANAHKDASYLLFVQDGMLYRLDAAAELARLVEAHQPLEHLTSLQSELASAMAPLSTQQQALGSVMQGTRDPATMGRIGRQQGSVGRRQGEIGREQGVIGRQQGILGRAFYQSTQETIDRCLKDKSCAAVGPVAPAMASR